MNRDSESEGLSRYDWFGIGSGVVGLVADTIAISSALVFSQGAQSVSLGVWLISFLGVSYTVFIVSFYARRVFAARHKDAAGLVSHESQEAIQRGAAALTYVVGVSLFFVFFFSTASRINRPSHLDVADYHFLIGIIVLFFVLPLAFGLAFAINYTAKLTYSAFDPAI